MVRPAAAALASLALVTFASAGLLGACSGGARNRAVADSVPPASAAEPRSAAPTPVPYRPDDGPMPSPTRVIRVGSSEAILSSIAEAQPGDVITVDGGMYRFSSRIDVNRHGEREAPIFLRAERPGEVTFMLSHLENFSVRARSWVFENIRFVGVCGDEGCEHAFHLVADADDVVIRDNEIVDFASHVKLNGEPIGRLPVRAFPDRLLVIRNFLHNSKYLGNDAPRNMLNLDGGRDHVVRGNIFADYNAPYWIERSASAVYAKAGVRGLLVEQNLIVCEHARIRGDANRGIELGDGMAPQYCDGDDDGDGIGDCRENGQSQEALVRNNIIMNCNNGASSAGIFVASDRSSRILHNTVLNGGGHYAAFHVGHPQHDTFYRANLLELGIYSARARRAPVETGNRVLGPTGMQLIFESPDTGDFTLADNAAVVDVAATDPAAPHDFCGTPRGAMADLGAVEYSAEDDGVRCVEQIRVMFERIRQRPAESAPAVPIRTAPP